jgi:hypothetical protein
MISAMDPQEPAAAPEDEDPIAELQARAAAARAAGRYRVDDLAAGTGGQEPFAGDRLEALEAGALVAPSLEVSASGRPVVGPIATAAKRAAVRAGFDNVARVAEQATRFNALMVGYAEELGAEVARLRRQVDALDERVARLEARAAEQGGREP